MNSPLARYLKDFGQMAPAAHTFVPDPLEDDISMGLNDFPDEPPADIEAERQQAYAEGQEAATRGLSETHEAEIEAMAEAHRGELDALKQKHEAEVAALMAVKFREIAAEVARAVSDGAATAIAPVLSESVAQASIANLARLLEEAILEGAAGPITVKGPAALFERLQSEIASGSGLLRHVEADDLDLSVDVGEAALVTRISAWTASLKKVLE
ncbi:hypothetical protein EV286_101176 [Rhizobium sp. BK251]|nr:hypothetical protein EV286_101176 [Rhizobium sp. BK251]